MIREAARAATSSSPAGAAASHQEDANDSYAGVEAVIDKDLTSSVLATDVGAALLIILTAVPQVYVNFGKRDQRALGAVTLEEIEVLAAEGHFPPVAWAPKSRRSFTS